MSSAAIDAIGFGQNSESAEQNIPLPGNTFFRAVVLHTLNDPSLRDPVADKDIIDTLSNRDFYLRAPRNSIICRNTTERQGLVSNNDIICFPFFSSHVMMPVKAGEQVWVLEINEKGSTITYYWLSRIAEPLHVEDANFTHGERRNNRQFKGNLTGDQAEDGSGNFKTPRKLTYQNDNPSQTDNARIAGNQDAFPTIITGSKESSFVSLEPVPRLTKRPGDLVLQGSNNTAIRLGTEMGWNADAAGRPQSSTTKSQASTVVANQLSAGLGAIDIVVGRGRYFQDSATEKDFAGKSNGQSENNTTRPYVVETVIPGTFENDKNVATQQAESVSKEKGNFKSNPKEGDPDFLMDASRVYVSTKSQIDMVLGTGQAGIAKKFENPIEDKTGASVAVKSDHIRIVARKSQLASRSSIEPPDIGNENPPTNGTIRIVKEGEPNSDLASIVIEADGSIQISGAKIFIGRKTDDGGEGGGPGPGASQPYVKYQQLEDLLNKTYDDLKTFVQKLQANFSSNTTPGFGGPNPALIKSAADECTQFLSAVASRKSEIQNLKSQRIFGE